MSISLFSSTAKIKQRFSSAIAPELSAVQMGVLLEEGTVKLQGTSPELLSQSGFHLGFLTL